MINYVVNNVVISSRKFDSENELRNFINHNGGSILSGEEYPQHFILIEIRNQFDDDKKYLGLLVEQVFLPQIVASDTKKQIWLVFDFASYLISLVDVKCLKMVRLPCLYWETIKLKDDSIIVIHELGAICIDNSGDIVWELNGSDKLNDYTILNDELKLIFDDETSKTKAIAI